MRKLTYGKIGAALGASRHGYAGAPVIDGAHLIVGVGGTNGASVVCFDKCTGQVIWKSQNDVAGYAGPAVAEWGGVKQVIAFTAVAVMGLDAKDGALLWSVPVEARLGRNITTPVVVDGMVLVSSHTAGLMGIRVTKEGAGWKATPAWVSQELAINMSSFVVVGHHVYGVGRNKKLICVDVATGAKAWATSEPITTSLVKDWAAFLVMRDKLLALTYDGQLLLIVADPPACRVLGRLAVCGKTWCNPAYADGKLFLRDAEYLLCLPLLP